MARQLSYNLVSAVPVRAWEATQSCDLGGRRTFEDVSAHPHRHLEASARPGLHHAHHRLAHQRGRRLLTARLLGGPLLSHPRKGGALMRGGGAPAGGACSDAAAALPGCGYGAIPGRQAPPAAAASCGLPRSSLQQEMPNVNSTIMFAYTSIPPLHLHSGGNLGLDEDGRCSSVTARPKPQDTDFLLLPGRGRP